MFIEISEALIGNLTFSLFDNLFYVMRCPGDSGAGLEGVSLQSYYFFSLFIIRIS